MLHYAIDGGRTVNFLAVVRVPQWANEAWMEECATRDAVDAFAGLASRRDRDGRRD